MVILNGFGTTKIDLVKGGDMKRIYGNFMMGIGIWFMKKGEKYATWHDLYELSCADGKCGTEKCWGCST